MIRKIVIVDDEQGEFAYERQEDPFQWRVRWPGGTLSENVDDGGVVLWQLVLALTEGVES